MLPYTQQWLGNVLRPILTYVTVNYNLIISTDAVGYIAEALTATIKHHAPPSLTASVPCHHNEVAVGRRMYRSCCRGGC